MEKKIILAVLLAVTLTSCATSNVVRGQKEIDALIMDIESGIDAWYLED